MKHVKKSMFFSTVLMVVLLIVALSTATFAWFSAAAEVTATASDITAARAVSGNIQIGWANTEAGLGSTITFDNVADIYPAVPTVHKEAAASTKYFATEGAIPEDPEGGPVHVADIVPLRTTDIENTKGDGSDAAKSVAYSSLTTYLATVPEYTYYTAALEEAANGFAGVAYSKLYTAYAWNVRAALPETYTAPEADDAANELYTVIADGDSDDVAIDEAEGNITQTMAATLVPVAERENVIVGAKLTRVKTYYLVTLHQNTANLAEAARYAIERGTAGIGNYYVAPSFVYVTQVAGSFDAYSAENNPQTDLGMDQTVNTNVTIASGAVADGLNASVADLDAPTRVYSRAIAENAAFTYGELAFSNATIDSDAHPVFTANGTDGTDANPDLLLSKTLEAQGDATDSYFYVKNISEQATNVYVNATFTGDNANRVRLLFFVSSTDADDASFTYVGTLANTQATTYYGNVYGNAHAFNSLSTYTAIGGANAQGARRTVELATNIPTTAVRRVRVVAYYDGHDLNNAGGGKTTGFTLTFSETAVA